MVNDGGTLINLKPAIKGILKHITILILNYSNTLRIELLMEIARETDKLINNKWEDGE